jgi:hypothetical protein
MLTAADLASMRETIEDSLPDVAVIKTRSWVSDGGGGGTTTYTAAGTVECRVAPISAAEKYQGERIHPDTEYVFTFPYDAAIPGDAVITVGSINYTVTGQRSPRSWEISRRVEAKEVT